MSKYALFAAALLLVFCTVFEVKAADVIDVSEGYDGIKWGESREKATTLLQSKYGSRRIQSRPFEIEGFNKGISMAIRGDHGSREYVFIADKFYAFNINRTFDLDSPYTAEDLERVKFAEEMEKRFKTAGTIVLSATATAASIEDQQIKEIQTRIECVNEGFRKAELEQLRATRPDLKEILLVPVSAP